MVKRTTAAALVMSGPGLARYPGGNLSRAGRRARVAGAHVAASGYNGIDAGTRLVLGNLRQETLAVVLAP